MNVRSGLQGMRKKEKQLSLKCIAEGSRRDTLIESMPISIQLETVVNTVWFLVRSVKLRVKFIWLEKGLSGKS